MAFGRCTQKKKGEKVIKKIHSIGRKGYGEISPMNKNEIHYPDICVTTEQVPFLDEVEVGERMSLLAICEVKSIRQEGKGKPKEISLMVKMLGEEGDMKMTKAVEKAIGEHKELDDKEESNEKETEKED